MNRQDVSKPEKNLDTRGFTLIEVLISLAIFSIGILAVAGMQIQSVNLNAKARMQTEATNLAVECLERLKMLPYDDPDLDEAANPHQEQSGSYTVQWKPS
jgi:type IV pilus modification protein PilV